MTVDEALRVEDRPNDYTSLQQATARSVLAAEVRRLRDVTPYLECECGRRIYIPAAEQLKG